MEEEKLLLSRKEDKYLKWLAEEMRLNHKHEELLARRELLLATTSSVYKEKEKQQKETNIDVNKAISRNKQLLEEVERIHCALRTKANNPSGSALIALRDSYLKEALDQTKQFTNE